MARLDRIRVLVWYFTVRSFEGAVASIASPLFVAITAITVLPRLLSKAYGYEVGFSILSGFIPLLAILSALPLAVIAVIEAGSGTLRHLLQAPIKPLSVAVARLLSLAPFSITVVIVGLTISEILYAFPPLGKLAPILAFVAMGSLGIAGTVLAAAYPFRNPQFAGITASALVIVFEYLSPVYYPLSAFPSAIRPVVLAVNPLAALMEYVRGNMSLTVTAVYVVTTSIIWSVIGAVLLAKKIESS